MSRGRAKGVQQPDQAIMLLAVTYWVTLMLSLEQRCSSKLLKCVCNVRRVRLD